jgi:hypothetical protein
MKSSDPDGAQHTDQFTKASSIMMGSKDTVIESMTDFLYDFITLFPPFSRARGATTTARVK